MQQRETRLREELQSKEAEIGRLREELRKCQALLQEGARQVRNTTLKCITTLQIITSLYSHVYFQVPLTLPLQLRWRCGLDMPFQMSGYVQSVMVQGTVYVGGGFSDIGSDKNCIVMAYDTSSGKWAKLPPYRAQYFAMTVINSQLVLVGGDTSNYIKVVGVWRPDSKKWIHPYPDMLTARGMCSAVGHKEWLIVAGGFGDGGVYLSSVEVLNTDTKQWSAGPPTPAAWSSMKTAVVGDVCYFMGGCIEGGYTNIVYSVSLPALTSQLNPKNSIQRDTEIWKKIPGLYLTKFTPLSIRGSLLAVSGRDKYNEVVSGIHLYQPDAGVWVKVGDLPTPRYNCICIKITDRELLVAGGWGGSILKSVDIAVIN